MKILLIVPDRHGIAQDIHEASSWFSRLSFAKRVGNFFARPWMPPLSVMEVAAMTPKDHQVTIYDELAQGRLDEGTLPEADLYGLTGLTTSRLGSERLAHMIRQRGKPVVAGGVDVIGRHRDGEVQEMLQTYDAIVVSNLTTRLWTKIILDLEKGQLEKVYQTEPGEWEFVIPRHDLINPGRYFLRAALRSSAGCGNHCKWCGVDQITHGKCYFKPFKLLEAELIDLPKAQVFIDCSDAFGMDQKNTSEVVLPLYQETGRHWITEISAKGLMKQIDGKILAERMAEAGCVGVYVGIESPYSRLSVKSMEQKEYERVIKIAKNLGMFVIGSFILDADENATEETVRQTVEWVISQRLEGVQYSLLAALPGTVARIEVINEKRLIDDNPEHLDGAWPSSLHQYLTPQNRIRLLAEAYTSTYGLSGLLKRLSFSRRQGLLIGLTILIANLGVRLSVSAWRRFADPEYWEQTRWLPQTG